MLWRNSARHNADLVNKLKLTTVVRLLGVIQALGVLIRVIGRLTALLVFLAVMVLVVTQSGTSPARSQAYSRINHLNAQIESLRRENLMLEDLVKFRRSDNFVIGQAKRELGLIESDDIGLEIVGLKDGIANPFKPEAYAVANYARRGPEIFDFGYIRAWVVKLAGSE